MPPKRAKRNPKVDEEIDRNLKRAFDAAADEPLPERLLSLLERLRAAEGAPASKQRAGGEE